MKNFFIIFLFVTATIFLPSQYLFASPGDPIGQTENQQPVAASEPATAQPKEIKAIEVTGNKTISLATILAKIKTRVGQDFLDTVLSDDLKRLYNTGYFSDVRVEQKPYENGLKLIIFVIEKPIIEEVTFSKTRQINSKSFSSKLKNQKGKFLDNKTLKDDVDTIKDIYVKKGLTEVTIDVEKNIDAATNKAKLHFVIKEGTRIRIKKINVSGNQSFKRSKILQVIKSRSKWLLRSGYLQDDTVSEDVERIKSFYEQHGFIDAKVDYHVDPLTKGYKLLTFIVEEGKQYWVEKISFVGNKIISEKELFSQMQEVKEAGIFSREKLSLDLTRIRTLYFDKGYIFADVHEATSLNSENGKVDIRLTINEGQPAYVHKIKVQGNTQTRDIVIRRELKLYPGDQFDGVKLRRSKEKINNLGYFEDVGFDIEDTDVPDQKDLVVQVKETKTGTISFGGGFSTVDKVIGFVEVEQRNFDFTNWPTFTGGGQHLAVRAETGSTRNNVTLSFTEPWLFDRPISAGFDIYRSEHDRNQDVGFAYDETRTGGDLRLGKQFSDYVRGDVTYRNEIVKIGNIESNVSADLLAEEGENQISSLGFGLTRDTRDNAFSTSKGWVLSGALDVAGGPLGGDKDFYRTQLRSSYYIPLKFKSVLELRGHVGFVEAYGNSEKVPIFERFFAGGATTIRGYDERGVGPLDAQTQDPIGGESLFVGNVEYTIPLVDFIKLAGFFDFGNVWAKTTDFGKDQLKSGAGFGLRVKTPIGPINLDYGYPLNDEPGKTDRSGKFYFSVSRGF